MENHHPQGQKSMEQGDSPRMNLNLGHEQRGLDLEGWALREQKRGYASSPNTSEFSDLNDLSSTKNMHMEREIIRIQEVLERNP
jgi:hypothetical protein